MLYVGPSMVTSCTKHETLPKKNVFEVLRETGDVGLYRPSYK